MAKAPRSKSTAPYKTVGETYDGVKVLAPKTKSKTFTASEVKRAIEVALEQVGAAEAKKSLRNSDAMRIEKRDDGRFGIKRPGAKRVSDIKDTQAEAVARARELDPGTAPIAKRVRKKAGAKVGTWRKT
jgi:uncharacterized protein YdaT